LSSLKVTQIRTKLLQLFEQHLDLSDIGAHEPDREVKILSRCVAALAVMLRSGCSAKDAASAVWDGSGDNGIDAVYFDQSESVLLLVQSKWISKGSGEPEAKEVAVFAKGVLDILEQDDTPFHQRLKQRLADVFKRISTPGVSVRIIVASTGATTLAAPSTSIIDGLLHDLNGNDPDPIASSLTIGLSEIYAGLASDPALQTVSLDATLFDWSYVAQPYPAYFGVIDGHQLKGWWRQHGKRLVSANIRHGLGATEVNAEIRATAAQSPEDFWYFNNGITLTADEALKAPAGASSHVAGIFQFRGASIVNGAQTVSSLGAVDDDAPLAKVRVGIRVILLKDAPAEFGKSVTRTNNLQNRVEPRDFAAQDPEQMRLRQEMALEGIEYHISRSEDARSTATSCDLPEVTTALACALGDSALAVQAKTGLGRFFADLSKAPYKTIFNPGTSGARAFNAVRVQRHIDDWIERTKAAMGKKSGPAWGVLVHGNRILAAAVFSRLGSKALDETIAAFPGKIDQSAIEAHCTAVHASMTNAVTTSFPGKFLAVLFKSPGSSKTVFDSVI
jgi:hypothetical protein